MSPTDKPDALVPLTASDALTTPGRQAPIDDQLRARIAEVLHKSLKDSSKRAYATEWRAFTEWCTANGRQPIPCDELTLAAYLTDQASRRKMNGLRRALSAIQQAHSIAGLPNPRGSTIGRLLKGLVREKGDDVRRVDPVERDDLKKMLALLGYDSAVNLRDRALITTGFLGAFRRSELAGLQVRDVELADGGLVIKLRDSKTHDETAPERDVVEIAPFTSEPTLCAVGAMRAWLERYRACVGVTPLSPVFPKATQSGHIATKALTDRSIAELIKRLAERAGVEGDFSGHSLRAGLITAMALAGATDRQIMRQSRHLNPAQVGTYVRRVKLFKDNAVGILAAGKKREDS